MKVMPFKGKWCSRSQANRVNDMLLSSMPPDRSALKKESEEFIEYIKVMRSKKGEDNQNILSKSGPYSIDEVPKIDIDYRGLVNYARANDKTVPELNDAEKEQFIMGASMPEVRERML